MLPPPAMRPWVFELLALIVPKLNRLKSAAARSGEQSIAGVGDGVRVGVLLGVLVGVLVGVSVGVSVGVAVWVGVLVGVSVGVLVGVGVGTSAVVLTVAQLLAGFSSAPFALSSPMQAVLVMVLLPGGRPPLTVTAKITEPLPVFAPPNAPTDQVQTLPAFPSGTQVQPGVLAAGLKVVLAGTVSVSTTPVASCVPALV